MQLRMEKKGGLLCLLDLKNGLRLRKEEEEWIERASFVTVAGDDDDSDLIFILNNQSMNPSVLFLKDIKLRHILSFNMGRNSAKESKKIGRAHV